MSGMMQKSNPSSVLHGRSQSSGEERFDGKSPKLSTLESTESCDQLAADKFVKKCGGLAGYLFKMNSGLQSNMT